MYELNGGLEGRPVSTETFSKRVELRRAGWAGCSANRDDWDGRNWRLERLEKFSVVTVNVGDMCA